MKVNAVNIVNEDQKPINKTNMVEKQEADEKGLESNFKVSAWGYRHQQCFILFCTLTIAYSMRSCMGVSLVAMTKYGEPILNATASSIADENQFKPEGILNALMLIPPYPTFNWNKKTQDAVIASFFWGYMTLQIPGGQLAHSFGARYLLTGAMMINCVVSILLPLAAYYGGWICTALCRVLQGLSQACIVPGLHTSLGKWAPLQERGRMAAFVYGGQALGTVFGLPMTGFISSSSLGWPGIFRFYGILSGIIGVLLFWLAADTPAKHPKISEAERKYVEDELGKGDEGKKMPVPWKKIFTHKGVYAIIIAHFGQTWGQLTLYSEVPAYLDKIMGVDIKANGLLTALPFLMMWFTNFFFSWMTDMLIVKNILSPTNTRKFANSLGASGAIRHVQTLMMFFALVIAYGMRVNMSMAIVVMTDDALENSFDWSMQTQSVILSSFFWGYIVLQIPAGEMAAKFGGMILVTTAIAINAFVSLAVPFAAYNGGWQLVCACRVVQGLAQGFVVPSIYNLIGKWTPVEEKSRTGAIINSGSSLGNAIQLVISGFIADAWGWEAIFYVNGAIGAVWVVIYCFVGSDSPQKSKLISKEERLYIQTSLGQLGEPKKFKTPWMAIWTSVPFISLIVLHCSQNWGYWTLMTEMPSYMKKVLGVDIKANGIMSAIPYLAIYILSFPFGYMSDYLPNKKWLSVTATRKLSNSIGFFGPAIALIGLSYVPAGNVTLAVILLTIVVGLNVGHLTGLMMVHLDMAPNYVGTLLGITNMAANIISIIAPLVAGVVLKDETNPDEWRKVFYIASAVYITGNTFYLIFGTSERQKWNEPSEQIFDGTPEKSAGKVV